VCEVIDLTTRKPYAYGESPDESSAVELAVANAKTAPKPLTPAQQADAAFVDAQAEIARLRAELAATKADKSPTFKPNK
jgi:hypothetical protein